ncbi:type 4a pilus biogenesis protein PilO [Candidatus Laterigemmans baculatus]|uniref:type 4a pilus biogenesis protein PilO n=1 Tax=Candidatus Laterigemmans baculatus TaxID=2770505 RepID=UPI0013DA6541|nr:type 4a pilus biogenesis protein PilO [Candidatus Laterigemmans baculatus]
MRRASHLSPFPAAKRLALHACGAAMVVAIPAAGYLLATRPLEKRLAESQQEQERLTRLIASADAVDAEVIAVREAIAATTEEMRALLRHLPDRPAMDPLIATISAAARAAGAEILALQPLQNRGADDAATQQLRLRLRCDHASLCRFLAELDRGTVAVWVAGVELRAEPVDVLGRGGGLRQAELTLRIPHAAEKTFAGQLKRTLLNPPEA